VIDLAHFKSIEKQIKRRRRKEVGKLSTKHSFDESEGSPRKISQLDDNKSKIADNISSGTPLIMQADMSAENRSSENIDGFEDEDTYTVSKGT
jgi:hypothetical protein